LIPQDTMLAGDAANRDLLTSLPVKKIFLWEELK